MTQPSILATLFDVLARQLAGHEVSSEALPELRFPPVPPAPLGPAIPRDLVPRHWRQYLRTVAPGNSRTLLDFGCGAAERRAMVEQGGLEWRGLDIPGSTESEARTDPRDVTLYDGLDVPLPSETYRVVLSVQTFEHVANPHTTFAEIARILEPGGYLVGSTSHIEAYHSDSTFTYTPAVFAQLLVDNGLDPVEIAAGIDGLTLLARRLARQFGAVEESKGLNPFFAASSPLNQILVEAGARQGVEPERINALKLELVGHFHFKARKS